jgi:hypothetical protein
MAHGLLSRYHRHISGISAQANRISTIDRGVRMTQLRRRNMFRRIKNRILNAKSKACAKKPLAK